MNVTIPTTAPLDCSQVSEVLGRVGEKWTMQVVIALRDQPYRFNEIKRHVRGISQQMLARTLKTLERDGMVKRTVGPTAPPQVEYELTALGRSLSAPVRQLAQWARAHLAAIHDNQLSYDATH